MNRSQKNFLQALLTVLVPTILICGFLCYKLGWQPDICAPFLGIILTAVLGLTWMLFNRYQAGTNSRRLSRETHLALAILSGVLGIGLVIEGFDHLSANRLYNLIFAAGWMLFAVRHLDAARKLDKAGPPANQ